LGTALETTLSVPPYTGPPGAVVGGAEVVVGAVVVGAVVVGAVVSSGSPQLPKISMPAMTSISGINNNLFMDDTHLLCGFSVLPLYCLLTHISPPSN